MTHTHLPVELNKNADRFLISWSEKVEQEIMLRVCITNTYLKQFLNYFAILAAIQCLNQQVWLIFPFSLMAQPPTLTYSQTHTHFSCLCFFPQAVQSISTTLSYIKGMGHWFFFCFYIVGYNTVQDSRWTSSKAKLSKAFGLPTEDTTSLKAGHEHSKILLQCSSATGIHSCLQNRRRDIT